ncbi:MAG: hypothetical protein HUK15_05835, partial [Bacteroidales bacterium]|nr:hypothetical protein [Bacteroidales bacterium]
TAIDSFDVSINIKNYGMATRNNFLVYVNRELPNGEETQYEITVDGCLYEKNTSIKLPTNIIEGPGMNRLRVYVDGMNEIDELSESNNFATLDFLIKSNDIFPIYPYEYAIYPNDTVTLAASTCEPFLDNIRYRFQIDTTDRFNSPMMHHADVVSEGGIVRWSVPFELSENVVYYWRVAAVTEENADLIWKESSFVYIEGETGWSQAHYYQFKKDNFNLMDYNPMSQQFTFSQTQRQLNCQTTVSGSYDNTHWSIDGVISMYSGGTANCTQYPAMVGVVIDPVSIRAWTSDMRDYGHRNYPKCFSASTPQPYFTFDINQAKIDSLNSLINDAPDGYYIMVYSWRGVTYSVFPQSIFNTLESLGATEFRNLPNNTAYIFCTRKGMPSIHREVYGNNIEIDPLYLSTNNDYGYIESVKIGPSLNWKSLRWEHESDADDEIALKIYGCRPNGEEEIVIDSIGASDLNIALNDIIDAQIYPNIKLSMMAKDEVSRTSPQLKKWQLHFAGVPETAIDPKLGFHFYNDTVERGEDIELVIATQNISDYDMDSLVVKYWLRDSHNHETVIDIRTLRPHPSRDIIVDTLRYSTLALSGLNSIWVEFNPINEATGTYYQPEQYHYNNIATKYFYVTADNKNPLLEVSFDGKFIMNGEIVSAKPEILITLKDENKYIALNDTSLFEIHITNLNSGETKRVNFGMQENPLETLEWIPAELPDNSFKIIYKPIFTSDGTYRLRVHAKDAAGNISGSNDYVIDFEIITLSTITHLLNYPNPFSSSTRFVFELTGSELPDELEIEIYTITGKVVKRIHLDELGPIYIGKNITEYAWDGYDDFGDRLANGVYFYTVKAKINGTDIEHRNTNADKYFKREVGKMYLLR